MWAEFKAFAIKGNLIDLAVAFVLGVAFAAVVTSFINDILMQLIAAVFGKPDFSALTFTLNNSEIRYGAFLTATLVFLQVAVALFFVLKFVDRVRREDKDDVPAAPPEDTVLLREIRDALVADRTIDRGV